MAILLCGLIASPSVRAAVAPALTPATVQSIHDGNGNVITRTDANGAVTQFTYDKLNRLIAIDYPGGTSPDVTFTYDVNGNRTVMTDATGTTNYGYDLSDRLASVNYPDGGFVAYAHDLVGNVVKMRYGNEKAANAGQGYTEVEYTYNEDNRITGVKDLSANTITTYTYNDAGQPLRRSLPNGVTTDYSYDGDGRLSGVDHKKADGTRICKYTYTLNAIGNRTQVVETLTDGSTKITSYSYEALDRLSAASYPDGRTVSYIYDSFGNRLKMTEVAGGTNKVTDYIYDADSRLVSTEVNGVADESFIYDATGNLIQRVRTNDNRQIDYSYDTENRLVRIFDGVTNVLNVFDGVGNRVAKIVNGVRTNFVNDNSRRYVQVLSETDQAGSVQRSYQWGNELIEQTSSATLGYHLLDSINGNVRRLIDINGGVLNSYEYDSFGSVMASSESVDNTYCFQGEAFERSIELVFLRTRFYDPRIGRFTARDQASATQVQPTSLNRYTFAENDPVNKVDPTGEVAPLVLGVIAGGLCAAGDGLYAAITPKGQRTLAGYATSCLAAGAIPFTAAAAAYFELSAAATAAAVTTAGASSGALNGAVSSKAQSIWGVATDAAIGAILNLPELNPIGGLNYRNTLYPSGLLTNSNLVNLAREGGNLGAHSIYDQIHDWISGGVRDSSSGSDSSRSLIGDFDFNLDTNFASNLPGGVALDKSASVLLDINKVSGGAYDPATGQIILYGTKDGSATALPKMNLDDLAVAVRAKQMGTFPVVSIEDPIVVNPPGLPSGQYATVRYGPSYKDSSGGQTKVLDVSSNTHFGWVMFEADRLLKSLVLGRDNRTLQPVSSAVQGYRSMLDRYAADTSISNSKERFWFEPKEIVVETAPGGNSMQITKAEMQLSTEAVFASGGQVEGTPEAESFAQWFSNNYDAIAEEQVSKDAAGNPHKIYKELKQLAYLAGVVKWIDDNHIPVDLTFLKNYHAAYDPEAVALTPQTTVSKTRNYGGGFTITYTVTGGVTFCTDLSAGTGGDPSGLGGAAVAARPDESALAWSFNSGGTDYNVTALSVDRTQKDGGVNPNAVDAQFKVNGAMPLTLGRFYNSADINPTLFGWGWQLQPYAIEFKGNREVFSLCHQTWNGYGEVWLVDRPSNGAYKFVPSGTYDRQTDPQHLASRFAAGQDILVYQYENKSIPGLLFSDNTTHMTMRLDSGVLLDFDFDGHLTRVEDRNGNAIDYDYDSSKRLTTIGQAGGKTVTLQYDGQNRVSSAALPDGRTVSYAYDGSGNLTLAQSSQSSGRILRYAYDASHNVTQVQDEAGNASATQTFDIYGRVTGITQPGVTTPFTETYDLATRTSQASGPEGTGGTVVFDAAHNPVAFADARSNSTTLTYNSFRDMTSMTAADGTTHQFYVDAAGHRVAVVMPNGRADRALFDGFGNPTVTFQGPVDDTFNASFDNDHILTTDGYAYYPTNYTQYSYDAKGNLLELTDANGHTRKNGYDSRGNKIWIQDGRGKQTDITFDAYSRPTATRNALGQQVSTTFDAHDNPTQVATLAGTIDYTYNEKDQVVTMTTGDAGARHTYRYTYDAKGNIATVTDPNNYVTQYTFDARGNLSEVKHDGIVRFTYDYDGLNRVAATHYTGTAGGARATLIPVSPAGTEQFVSGSPISVTWLTQGDWSGSPNVTIQYSTNGTTWTDIATVNATTGSYQWNNPPASDSVLIRFVRSGDSGFRVSVVSNFSVVTTQKYYVNDGSTAGDQYCTAVGKAYNGVSVTGRSPGDPVDDPQTIIDHYTLRPGDTIYIDTGNYSLNHDIVITEADCGSATRPVTFQGPTSGPGAVLTRVASALPSSAVFDIYDTNPGDATPLQGITIQNVKLAKGTLGIQLTDASYCVIRSNECYQNGLAGSSPSGNGIGTGIVVSGGGHHLIEGNSCHDNGGAGAAGTAASPNGGVGSGYGLYIIDSSYNSIRQNDCAGNGAPGANAGASSGFAGNSIGGGITVIMQNARMTDNVISENSCHDTSTTGVTATSGDSGWSVNTGIWIQGSDNSRVEGNTVLRLTSTGGNSSTVDGGLGLCVGIRAIDNANFVVTRNIASNLDGNGGATGTSSASLQGGEADAVGIIVDSSAGALVSNNLAFDNFATAVNKRGQEQSGLPYAAGIYVIESIGSKILNNTFALNRPMLNPAEALSAQSGQIFAYSNSTGLIVKNNLCISPDPYCPAISFDDPSRVGVVSDYNDFYSQGGNVGAWGDAFQSDLAAWQAVTGQDAHSLSLDPIVYNAAGGNFHLSAASPLIDAGVTLTDVPLDGDGESRPARGPGSGAAPLPDIGYDEFVDSDGDGLPDIVELKVTFTNPNSPDTDKDGLPDGWEVTYGLDPNDSTGANGRNGDPDGDGFTNWQEFVGHSNPKLATSVPDQTPVITSTSPAGTALLILEDDAIDFSAAGTTASGAAPAFSWTVDGTVKGGTSTFHFATDDESSGATTLSKVYTVMLHVKNGSSEVTRSWAVTVNNRNHAPVLQPFSNIEARPGDTVQLSPVYSDPDNQNGVTGDDNVLTVEFSGFMTGPTKTLTDDDIGTHTVTVTVRDNGIPSLSAQRAVVINVSSGVTPPADQIRPTISLTKPQINQKITGTAVTVSGLAKDDRALDRVEILLNGTLVTTTIPSATPATSFAFVASVLPEQGINEVEVRAFDSAGNMSGSVKRKFTFAHARPELAGTYSGLMVADPSANQLDDSGLVKIVVGATGSFSIRTTLRDTAIASTGVFLNDGTACFGPARATTLPLVRKVGRTTTAIGELTLKVDLTGGRMITGELASGTTVLASISHADLATYSASNKVPISIYDPGSEKGMYTALLMPGQAPNNGLMSDKFPQGTGYASFAVSPAGVVTIKGRSADNQAISYSNSLSKTKELPVFIPLYAGGGFMSGAALFDSQNPTSDVSSSFRWCKSAGMPGQTTYPAGWPDGIAIDFAGSKYVVPKRPITFTALGPGLAPATSTTMANLQTTLEEGGLSAPFPVTQGSINAAGKVTLIDPVPPIPFTMSFTTAKGIFSGGFTHPVTHKSISFSGRAFQKTNSAGGFFMYTPPAASGTQSTAISGAVSVTKHQ